MPRRHLIPIALVLLALALRLWFAGSTPLHPDEIHYAYDVVSGPETASLHAIRDMHCAMEIERRTAHPMAAALLTRWLWFLPLGHFMDWSPLFLRCFNVILGMLAIAVAAAAANSVGGVRRGVLAAALVAFSPAMVWISGTMYLDPLYTLLIATMIWGVAQARRYAVAWPVLVQGAAFGLAVATKISAPVLLPPFLLGLAFGAPETGGRARGLRAAGAIALAAAIVLLLCDPTGYFHAITQPTDPRYSAYWEQGGLGGYLTLAFITLWNYAVVAFWDCPGTLLPAVLVAAFLAVRRREAFEAYLLFTLACMSPLLLMHMSTLSGPHGFMPIHLVLCLLASRLADASGRGAVAALATHLLLCGAAIGLRASQPALPGATDLIYPPRDQRFGLLRSALFQRRPNLRIVVLDEWIYRLAWITTMRNAQLAEGAIFFYGTPDHPPTDDVWELADVVMATQEMAGRLQPPPEFSRRAVTIDSLPYFLFRRQAGQALDAIPLAQLDRLPNGRRLLPGHVYPVTGHLLFNGVPLPPDARETSGIIFRGRSDFSAWRNGELSIGPGIEAGSFTITPPQGDDIFWSF